MKCLFCAVIFLFVTTTVQSADPNVLKKPFFGLRLGESIQDVSKKYKIEDVTEDHNDVLKTWNVKTNNPQATRVAIETFNDKVYRIMVNFKDTSKENFNAIKKKLISLYGRERVGTEKLSLFRPNVEGVNVEITLCIQGEDENLFINYKHRDMDASVDAATEKIKQDKIGNDL